MIVNQNIICKDLEKLKAGNYYMNPFSKYLCQFASRELVSDILNKNILTKEDPKWKEFGYHLASEYDFWSTRLCGLVCVKMVLDTFDLVKNETIASLSEKAIQLGGYIVYDESGEFVDKGWYYAPLIELAKEYGLNGKVCNLVSENELCSNVMKNIFSIVSVNPKVIRFDIDECPNAKGGHLVLIVGFKWDKEKCAGFYIHNPSGREKKTQEKAFIPIERFKEAFSEKGFVIYKE